VKVAAVVAAPTLSPSSAMLDRLNATTPTKLNADRSLILRTQPFFGRHEPPTARAATLTRGMRRRTLLG
jgi:hypothetical protein